MAKLSMELEAVRPVAANLAANLAAGCDRIEVAGSIRRGEVRVGDIEIVCIPTPIRDLLGEPAGHQLTGLLAVLVDQRVLQPYPTGGKAGPKFRNYLVPAAGINLDLFMVAPETWGVLLAIRTGPAAFSKALVTERCHGGLLRDGCHVREGRLYERGTLVSTPEEEDFMAYAGGWVPPGERRKRIPEGLAWRR